MDNDIIEVRIKIPGKLHDRLADFCAEDNLELDKLVCDLIQKWLLGQMIANLEASGDKDVLPRGGIVDRDERPDSRTPVTLGAPFGSPARRA